MKNTLFFLVAAILLTAAGSWIYYVYGYKDSMWVLGTAYTLVIFGFLCLLGPLVSFHYRFATAGGERPGVLRKIARVLYAIVYIGWLAGMVAWLVIIGDMKDQRVEKILSTEDVVFTSAKVVRIEERRMKNTSHIYAVIEYNADGSVVEQAIKDDVRMYRPDQEIKIKYSGKYPDMFAVLPPHLYMPPR